MRERARSINNTTDFLITPTMYAPLETSLVLRKGTGDPTWSRTTKAWGFNELGYLEELASGCAFFGGARLVRNTVRTTSEDFSNAAWTKANGTTTPSANVVLSANATSQQSVNQIVSGTLIAAGQVYIYCVRAKYVAGGVEFIQLTANGNGFGSGQYCNFSLLNGTKSATGCTATASLVSGTSDTYDFSIKVQAVASGNYDAVSIILGNAESDTRFPSFIGDGIKSFELLRAWSVDVTNYDASYVPEYVSVGVEASPYFGAGIDGAKYFSTDYTGGRALTNLDGFRRESAATNNVLYCRNLTNNSWIQTLTTGSEIITNGTFDADTNWTKGSGWSISAGVATRTDVGSSSNLIQAVSISAGTAYLISYDLTVSSGNITATFGGGTTASGIPRTATGTYSEVLIPNSGNYELRMNASSSFVGTLDNISIKVAAVQPAMTAIGLGGIANTATILTATAANAIILQPITLASAARCASAYVKRRTGTGTVSFTQDGGSTWTDITSQINSSTWSRVQVTATLANPSVGFKIGEVGDAIDVDCVQNEAGSVATSPIITTSAAVTRNAEILTYQVSGNIDFTVGTAIGSVQSSGSSALRYLINVGTAYSYISSAQANTEWRVTDGTNTTSISGLQDLTAGRVKRAISWSGGSINITGDGVTPVSGTFDGTFGDGSTISIGLSLNGTVRDVAIWPVALTNAQLQALTA